MIILLSGLNARVNHSYAYFSSCSCTYNISLNLCGRISSKIPFHTMRAIIKLNQSGKKPLYNYKYNTIYFGAKKSFKLLQSIGLLIFPHDLMKQPIFSRTLKRAIFKKFIYGSQVIGIALFIFPLTVVHLTVRFR